MCMIEFSGWYKLLTGGPVQGDLVKALNCMLGIVYLRIYYIFCVNKFNDTLE